MSHARVAVLFVSALCSTWISTHSLQIGDLNSSSGLTSPTDNETFSSTILLESSSLGASPTTNSEPSSSPINIIISSSVIPLMSLNTSESSVGPTQTSSASSTYQPVSQIKNVENSDNQSNTTLSTTYLSTVKSSMAQSTTAQIARTSLPTISSLPNQLTATQQSIDFQPLTTLMSSNKSLTSQTSTNAPTTTKLSTTRLPTTQSSITQASTTPSTDTSSTATEKSTTPLSITQTTSLVPKTKITTTSNFNRPIPRGRPSNRPFGGDKPGRRKQNTPMNLCDACVVTCGTEKKPICAKPLGDGEIDSTTLRGFQSSCHLDCFNTCKKTKYEKLVDGRCGRLKTRIRPVDSKDKLTRVELSKTEYEVIQDPSIIIEFAPVSQ